MSESVPPAPQHNHYVSSRTNTPIDETSQHHSNDHGYDGNLESDEFLEDSFDSIMFGMEEMEDDPYFQTEGGVSNSNQKVRNEDWTDVEPSRSTTKFTIDCSRKVMWTLGKSEGNRIRTRLRV